VLWLTLATHTLLSADALEAVSESEVGARTGVFVNGAASNTLVDTFVAPGVFGRYRLAGAGRVLEHAFIEADVAVTEPVSSAALSSVVVQMRLGVTFSTWSVAVGVWSNICLGCVARAANVLDGPRSAFQVLPSVVAQWRPTQWGVALGVFDQPLGMLGHVDLQFREFSLGYSLPVGAFASYRPRVAKHLTLLVEAMGFRISGAFSVGLNVGLQWGFNPG
jgi:hypothetical protein